LPHIKGDIGGGGRATPGRTNVPFHPRRLDRRGDEGVCRSV